MFCFVWQLEAFFVFGLWMLPLLTQLITLLYIWSQSSAWELYLKMATCTPDSLESFCYISENRKRTPLPICSNIYPVVFCCYFAVFAVNSRIFKCDAASLAMWVSPNDLWLWLREGSDTLFLRRSSRQIKGLLCEEKKNIWKECHFQSAFVCRNDQI